VPELPEVETIASAQAHLVGRTIVVRARPTSFGIPAGCLSILSSVSRSLDRAPGKYIIRLVDDLVLLVHLGMAAS
jgi:formamidopyrimidine-DNA glycosylase